MSSKATAWVWTIADLPPLDRLFMLWLAESTNDDDVAKLGKTEIADVLNCSTRSVTNIILRLERRRPKILEIRRRWDPDRELHFPNEYRLMIDQADLWGREGDSRGSGKSFTRENASLGKSAADFPRENGSLGKQMPTKIFSSISKEKEKEKTSAPGSSAEPFVTTKNRRLRGIARSQFMAFVDAFGFGKRIADAGDAWFDLCKGQPLDKPLNDRIVLAAAAECKDRPRLIDAGINFKYMTGWIRGRCWEDFDAEQRKMKERLPWYKTEQGIINAAAARGIMAADHKTFMALAGRLLEDLRVNKQPVPDGLIEFLKERAAA